jgi:hypothetical protein
LNRGFLCVLNRAMSRGTQSSSSTMKCFQCRLDATEDSSNRLIGLRLFHCPLGHKSYANDATGEFRKTAAENVWHFLRVCSQWPANNFISVRFVRCEATVCSECLSKAR